jgi:hypothetical protein
MPNKNCLPLGRMDSRVCLKCASGKRLFGFSTPVSSSHHGFVTVALKFVCSLDHFFSCGFALLYVIGKGSSRGIQILTHNLARS